MKTRGSVAPIIKLAAATTVAIVLVVAGRRLGAGAAFRDAIEWISSLGALAPVAFIMIYIVACVLFVPGSVISLGAGALFGVVWGSIYVAVGATIGATAAFLIGRYLAREWVARKLEGNATFKAIDAAVGREGWKIVGLTRLSPVFPFNLLNYAYGLTAVSLRDYVIATGAGILPGTVMYVYIGSLAGSLTGADAANAPPTAARWVLNLAGLAATAAVVLYTARIARRALVEHTRDEAGKAAGASEIIDPAPNTFVEKPSPTLR
jgi:uncharacterized membrane protein YdjX (TVP38/TMEM64 family)